MKPARKFTRVSRRFYGFIVQNTITARSARDDYGGQ